MYKARFEVYNVTQEALGMRVARRSSAAGHTGRGSADRRTLRRRPRAGGCAAVPGAGRPVRAASPPASGTGSAGGGCKGRNIPRASVRHGLRELRCAFDGS